jgi:hypothetical protein
MQRVLRGRGVSYPDLKLYAGHMRGCMDNDRSLAYPLAPFGRLVHAFDRGPLHAQTPKQCIIKGALPRRRRKDAQELLSSGALPPITQSARQKFRRSTTSHRHRGPRLDLTFALPIRLNCEPVAPRGLYLTPVTRAAGRGGGSEHCRPGPERLNLTGEDSIMVAGTALPW